MVRHTGEHFIDVEGIPEASVLPFQSSSVQRAEFDAPKANRFTSDNNAALCREILYVTVTEIEIEAIVEPDGATDDVGRESVALVSIHRPILSISAS